MKWNLVAMYIERVRTVLLFVLPGDVGGEFGFYPAAPSALRSVFPSAGTVIIKGSDELLS